MENMTRHEIDLANALAYKEATGLWPESPKNNSDITALFWKCDCQANFIHRSRVEICEKCFCAREQGEFASLSDVQKHYEEIPA